MSTALDLHYNYLVAVHEELKVIGLEDISPSNITLMEIPLDDDRYTAHLPAILVAPMGTETIGGGTNASEDIGYPILIAVIEAANEEQSKTTLKRHLRWREQIIDTFIHRHMPIDNVFHLDTTVEPGPIIDAGAWLRRQLFESLVVLRCKARKQRRID